MPVKQTIPYSSGTFFITFTCYKWLCLIELINGYDIVYSWFDHLKNRGHYINGFVIMPNHAHVLISFIKTPQNINTIVGNGKRFMAYEIIRRLQELKELNILELLANEVSAKRKLDNKQHNVWEPSFDWKLCEGTHFINQKLDYTHNNPCSGKWRLCNSPAEYLHSSAKYYIEGCHSGYEVTNIMLMEDVKFED